MDGSGSHMTRKSTPGKSGGLMLTQRAFLASRTCSGLATNYRYVRRVGLFFLTNRADPWQAHAVWQSLHSETGAWN